MIFENFCIIYLQKKGFFPWLIRAAQSIYSEDRYLAKSKWDHVVLKIGNYIYESTLRGYFSKEKNINGCSVTNIMEFTNNIIRGRYKRIGVQFDFLFSQFQIDEIKKTAEEYIIQGRKYAWMELFGTLKNIIKHKLAGDIKKADMSTEKNCYDTPAVYCCAFVADCLETTGQNFCQPDSSLSTIDDLWYSSSVDYTRREFSI